MNEARRCAWAETDPLLRAYHDKEWGVPQHDSRALWEFLMLEGFQAGLAWITVLRKREAFRKAFRGFQPKLVAAFAKPDVTRLLENPGIIRSRAKIEATIEGARIYEEMRRNGEDFCRVHLEDGRRKTNQTQNRPGAGKDATVRRDICGAKKARLQVRRPSHRLRLDAGLRDGKRPRSALLPAQRWVNPVLTRISHRPLGK